MKQPVVKFFLIGGSMLIFVVFLFDNKERGDKEKYKITKIETGEIGRHLIFNLYDLDDSKIKPEINDQISFKYEYLLKNSNKFRIFGISEKRREKWVLEKSITDPWGNPYSIFITKKDEINVLVLSAGPNGKLQDKDDIRWVMSH